MPCVYAIGVDPRTYESAGVEFYELDLAGYAEYFHENRESFDVICIARSRVQTMMESLRVSKRLGHAGTTWILGLGDLAARAALAIRLMDPGFVAKRLFVQRGIIYVVQRSAGAQLDEEVIADLPEAEVKKRLRWLDVLRLPPKPRA